MQSLIATTDTTGVIADEPMLLDLEQLSEAELAQVGGARGAFIL